MQKGVIISIGISIAIIGVTLYIISQKPIASLDDDFPKTQNVEIRDGVQYVTIDARGGYFPHSSHIQPNIPTKLLVRTNGTYDCSASLIVRSVGFQKILKPTGEEVIDLGALKPGEEIQGVCGMGMYSFLITSNLK